MAFLGTWSATEWSTVAGGAVLLVGAIGDFREGRFRNSVFVVGSLAGLAVSIALGGWAGAQQSALGFVGGFTLFMPLVLLGAIGAGDMKLLAAFGAACGWTAVAEVAVFGMIWGTVFGITQAALRGEATQVFRNAIKVAATRSGKGVQLHRIPFAAALLIGWATLLTYEGLI